MKWGKLELLENKLAKEKKSTRSDWLGLVLLWYDLCLEEKKREVVPRDEEGRGGRALGTWRLNVKLIFGLELSQFGSLSFFSLQFHGNEWIVFWGKKNDKIKCWLRWHVDIRLIHLHFFLSIQSFDEGNTNSPNFFIICGQHKCTEFGNKNKTTEQLN